MSWLEALRQGEDRPYPTKPAADYPLVFKSTLVLNEHGQTTQRHAVVCANCWGQGFLARNIEHYRVQTTEVCPTCKGLG